MESSSAMMRICNGLLGGALPATIEAYLRNLSQHAEPGRSEGEHFETPEASRRAGGNAVVLRAGEQ